MPEPEVRRITPGLWSWACGRCKTRYASTSGSRTIIRKGAKVKICAACVTELKLPPPVRQR